MTRLSKFLWILCLSLAVPATAMAQDDAPSLIEEVDPGATTRRPARADPPREKPARAADEAFEDEAPVPAVPAAAPRPSQLEPTQIEPARAVPVRTEPARTEPAVPAANPSTSGAGARARPQSIVLPKSTDADLQKLWTKWKKALADQDRTRTEALQKELLALRAELGITDLDVYAAAVTRLSAKRRIAADPVGAIELSVFATELAPNLAWAHLALARAYFSSDPTDVGRYMGALFKGIGHLGRDPRTMRPLIADVSGALIAALLATVAAILGILFLRAGRYFLHDFHHLFPRAAARWQTIPLAVIVLSLPWVFRLGLVPSLLVMFAALTLYLKPSERIVTAAALIAVTLTPLFAHQVSRHTAFFRTPAEDVLMLERGGPEAAGAIARVKARDAQGQASWSELFAWGRYTLRRGQLEEATELFKKAAVLNGNDGRLQVNLGNARFGAGDLEGARAQYVLAAELAPTLAAAHFNLARYHERKAAMLPAAEAAQEAGNAQLAQSVAEEMDKSILLREVPPKDAPAPFNLLLVSPSLNWADMAPLAVAQGAPERLAGQLSWRMLGSDGAPGSVALLVVLAALIAGVGGLGGWLRSSRRCDNCGLAVCRRCDRDLSVGSGLCSQCVNAFTKKGVVAPRERVRKQLEVDRFRSRQERWGWLLAFVCSGAGHLFSGRAVRGAAFAFAFLFGVFVAAFGNGVFRTPLGELPMLFRLLPALVVLGGVYLLSLRSFRKAQAR